MADESTTAAINATIDGYLAAFPANDRAAYVGAFAADGWLEDPAGAPRRVGPEGIGGFWDEARSMADSLDLVPTGFRVVVGNEAVLTLQARPVIGGQTFTLDIVDHMTFDEAGKIASVRAFFDPTTMAPLEGVASSAGQPVRPGR